MAESAYDEFDLVASRPEAPLHSFGAPLHSGAAPVGVDDLERYPEYDFGPLRVRVPAEAELRMADPDAVYSDAAFFVFPDGTVRLSVLAVPRGARLWPERAEEIATTQANLGAEVCSYSGQWGRELRITDDGQTNWVIGVDGARWMLLGRSSGPIGADTGLVETMRQMIRASVVFRGEEPLPARTPLPLREPDTFHTDDHAADRAGSTPYAGVITLVLPKIDAPVADDPGTDPATAPVTQARDAAVPDAGPPHGAARKATADPACATRVPPASRPDQRASPHGAAPAADTEQNNHHEVAPDEPRARLASVRDSEPTAPRSRARLLAAAALVALAAAAAVVLTGHGSPPDNRQLASPQQVNSTPQAEQPSPGAYPGAPTPARGVAPAPQAATPSAPAATPRAALPAVPAAEPARSPVMTPGKSPATGNRAVNPLTHVTAHPIASNASRTTGPPATKASRSGPDRSPAPPDHADSHSGGSTSRNDRTQGDGLIGALSNDVLSIGSR